jgi:transcriptional regulator with XRE-family HTH domain
MEIDPFEGLGRALAELRKRAGFKQQKDAAEVLGVDKGQLSRWERDKPRPSLENLTRVLAGYGATLTDLAVLICGERSEPPAEPEAKDRGHNYEELIWLAETIRRIEGRQRATEGRVLRLEEEFGRL